MKKTMIGAATLLILIPLIAYALEQPDFPPKMGKPFEVGTKCKIQHPSVYVENTYEIVGYSPLGWVQVVRVDEDRATKFWLNLQHATGLFPVKPDVEAGDNAER